MNASVSTIDNPHFQDLAPPTVEARVQEVLRSDAAEGEMRAAIDAGASCAELFKARNALDPKLLGIQTIDYNIRKIGCYSRSSTRKK